MMNQHVSLVPTDDLAPLAATRPAPDPVDARPVLDLSRLTGIAWHYRWLAGGIVLGCILLGLALTLLMTPRYTAAASVQIDQEEQRILDSQQDASSAAWQDADRFLKTHVDVLRSRRMGERVAEELDLFSDADAFFETMHITPRAGGIVADDEAQRDQVLETIADNLEIYLPPDSRIVTVSFTSPDPHFSAKFANAFVASYLRYNVDRRLESTEYARDFLSRQLAEARDRLERAERDANTYARAVGLVRTPSQVAGVEDTSITAIDLANDNAALAAARTDRIAAQAKWNLVAQAPDTAIADAVANQAMQQLIASRANVQAQLQAELANKQPNHPAVAPLRGQVEQYDAQIAALADGIRRSIRDQYRIAAQREGQLQARVNGLKGATQRERDDSVQLNTLTREVDTSRQLYDGLLQRYRETSAEANITSNNVQQIDRAQPPVKPSSPRLLLNLALAALFGMVLAGIVVFLREQGNDRIRKPAEIGERLGLKLLGITPLLKHGEDPVAVLAEPKEPLTEAFTSLRTALQFATPAGLPQRLLLTSTEAAEGKSSTAYGIARSLAESGRRTLLIDCDLRRPSIHELTGTRQTPGLTEVLTAGATGEQAIVPGEVANLSILPSGTRPNVPTDVLASLRFAELLTRLEERFEVIVLDGPPVLGLADATILANLPGVSTLFVAEAGRSHSGAARGAVRRLVDNGAAMIGAVLARFDFADSRRLGLGHEYGHGYAYYEYGA